MCPILVVISKWEFKKHHYTGSCRKTRILNLISFSKYENSSWPIFGDRVLEKFENYPQVLGKIIWLVRPICTLVASSENENVVFGLGKSKIYFWEASPSSTSDCIVRFVVISDSIQIPQCTEITNNRNNETFLRKIFPKPMRWSINWPSRSCDLIPC